MITTDLNRSLISDGALVNPASSEGGTLFFDGGSAIPDEVALQRKAPGGARSLKRPRQIVGLLRHLGVPRRLLYVRDRRQKKRGSSLWTRPVNHLEVLEHARQAYRRRIIDVHPDKPGGSLEQTVELNRTWGEIKKRFRSHGHELW